MNISRGSLSASSVAGFLNITADSRWLADRLSELVEHPAKGVERDSKRTVVVDYSSPNIAKEMHVGHLRSTVIGDSLVRILEMKGNKVIRENHVGDWGTPFGMLIERLEDLESDGVQPSDALADLGTFYRDARASFDTDKNFRERARKRVWLFSLEMKRQWHVENNWLTYPSRISMKFTIYSEFY